MCEEASIAEENPGARFACSVLFPAAACGHSVSCAVSLLVVCHLPSRGCSCIRGKQYAIVALVMLMLVVYLD
ncbi:MAG: hypothetical protein CSB23_01785 [Deltaproteobacteria bacterium]|nr:MAG: hypothetical protein CSB23_01785 [Deltaproteobacteria bacterium]